MNLSKVAAIVFAIAVSPNSALAQDCASIKDSAKRLQCYDKSNTKTQAGGGTVARAQAAIRQKLKDPDSAKFGKTIVKTVPNAAGKPTTVVCGTVNAKNAFGGYVGERPFMVFAADNEVHLVAPDASLPELAAILFNKYCIGAGDSKDEVEKDTVDLEDWKP